MEHQCFALSLGIILMSLALDIEQIYAIAEGRHYELFSVLGQHSAVEPTQGGSQAVVGDLG